MLSRFAACVFFPLTWKDYALRAVWNSCNECSASGLYVSFVMTLVAQEDASRPIWPGCPSKGWATGVHRLTGLPNGRPLSSAAEAEVEPELALATAGSTGALAAADGAEMAASTAPSCTFEPDVGYQNPAGGKSAPAASKESCCEQCWADKYCVVGVFLDKTCWMKYDNTGKVHKKGVVSCVTTKTPHPPPKPHTMETHGPCKIAIVIRSRFARVRTR